MAHYLIIGQGRIGKPLAKQLAITGVDQGDTVTTVARSHHDYDEDHIRFLQKDARSLTADDVAGVTHIAIIVTPRSSTGARATAKDYQDSYLAVCEHLSQLADSLDAWHQHLQQVLFVSSTAVYGENDGEWIDEHTPAVPSSPTAQVLRQAETVLQTTFGHKAVIVRPSGIYHLDSTRLIDQAADAHQSGVPSHHYTNRIMDSDLVTVLAQIMLLSSPKPIYLATDSMPAISLEVLSFIAKQMCYPPPKSIQTHPSGKQICGNIDPAWLKFADYQAGYLAVMAKYRAEHGMMTDG